MNPSELLSNEFTVRWDEELQSLVIVHPDKRQFPTPLVQIRSGTFEGMTFAEASEFVGSRLVLLIPALRARYVDPKTGELHQPQK